MATTVMPAFLATMGVAAFWVGLIEGVADGLSSFAKMASGYYTDKLPRRNPVAVNRPGNPRLARQPDCHGHSHAQQWHHDFSLRAERRVHLRPSGFDCGWDSDVS